MIQVLPPAIVAFLKEIESLGFSLCLVGGITRDYFLDNRLGNDFDIEIRPSLALNISLEEWPIYLKKLQQHFILLKISFEELPYHIVRVKWGEWQFEFSSPRLEINLPAKLGHHHFKEVLDPTLSYLDSFKRRDLTINAIGIELALGGNENFKIIDPYGGLNDLKKGILKNINDDFFLDHVRFLRLIRFKLKFKNFVIDQNLLGRLSRFNLSDLSPYYFLEELNQSPFGEFLDLFKKWVENYKIIIPDDYSWLIKCQNLASLSSADELLAEVYLNHQADVLKVINFFSMPQKKLKDLKSFLNSYYSWSSITQKEIDVIFKMPLEQALNQPFFKDLKNLDDKKKWCLVFNSTGLIKKELYLSFEDFKKITVSREELESISPAVRSYFLYYKALKQKVDS